MQDNHDTFTENLPKLISLLNHFAELIGPAGCSVPAPPYGAIAHYGLLNEESIRLLDRVSARAEVGLTDGAKRIIKEWIEQIAVEEQRLAVEEQRLAVDFIAAIEEGRESDVISLFSDDPGLTSFALEYFALKRDGIWLEPLLPPDFDHPHGSHLGGIPSLYSHSDWPYDHDGRRAFFVGQLDCEEISRILPGYLPKAGILCFFMDQDIEGGWKEDGTRKCYVVHVPGGGDICIKSVPDDYPKFGNWMSAIADLRIDFASPDGRELQPRIWPHTDLKPYKVATFAEAWHYCKSVAPGAYDDADARNFSIALSGLIGDIKNRYLDQKRGAIWGPRRDEEQTTLLFPDTVPPYFFQYEERAFSSYPPGYPWSRYHIVRTLQAALASAREEFRDLKSHRLKELTNDLELEQRYCTKYAWGYGEVRNTPDHLVDSTDITSALEAVRSRSNPYLWEGFLYWLELEEFYKEGVALLDTFIDDQFFEPTDREKEEFVTWVAGWVNHGCARRDERLGGVIAEKGYPIRVTEWTPWVAAIPKSDHDFYRYFADHLPRACREAFERANIVCASHSAEVCVRLPKSVVDNLLQRSKSLNVFHKCLGFGDCVQHAAYRHKDKILLLEVQSDSTLFTNFGDGALQFWIDREDLAALRFDDVFMTSECT